MRINRDAPAVVQPSVLSPWRSAGRSHLYSAPTPPASDFQREKLNTRAGRKRTRANYEVNNCDGTNPLHQRSNLPRVFLTMREQAHGGNALELKVPSLSLWPPASPPASALRRHFPRGRDSGHRTKLLEAATRQRQDWPHIRALSDSLRRKRWPAPAHRTDPDSGSTDECATRPRLLAFHRRCRPSPRPCTA